MRPDDACGSVSSIPRSQSPFECDIAQPHGNGPERAVSSLRRVSMLTASLRRLSASLSRDSARAEDRLQPQASRRTWPDRLATPCPLDPRTGRSTSFDSVASTTRSTTLDAAHAICCGRCRLLSCFDAKARRRQDAQRKEKCSLRDGWLGHWQDIDGRVVGRMRRELMAPVRSLSPSGTM